jgi:carbon-monoxide dehydrogenase large subunit
MAEKYFGVAMKRREDPALITGQGKYTDDLVLPNMAYAAIIRSVHAHARIKGIDTSKAKAAAGVVAVFTGQDLKDSGTPGMLPVGWLLPDMKIPAHPALATDVVRYVGDAVAVVVAEDRYTARDAADLIEVDYEPLPSVTDVAKAAQASAPRVHADLSDNIAFDWAIGDKAAVEQGFAQAAHTVKLDLRNNRLIPHAIEPRATLADYNSAKGELTVWMTTQNPHVHRLLMTLASLGLPEHKIRVIAPEVGGGFGSKIHHYPDEAITAWCSMQVKRPVKWTATRTETNVTDAHGRDHVTTAELALDKDGKILGLRIDTLASMGAYLSTFAPAVPTYLYGTLMSGQYDIPAIHCRVRGIFTNTTPVDAYRGAGRPEATFVVERLMHLAADQVGLDQTEIRKRNFVKPEAFPYQTQVALLYDSGNYAGAMDKALQLIGYSDLRAEQAKRRQAGSGKLLGIGFSSFIEACGLAPSAVVGSLGAQAGQWESAQVRVHPTGTVTVYSGSSAHGQGHETTFAQLVADKLGVDIKNVEVVHGDTGQVQYGWGTYGSRSAAVGGSAIVKAVDKVIDKGRKIAAHLLEAAEEDVTFENGSYFVRGAPDQAKPWGDIALMAHLAHNYPAGLEPGLAETAFYDPGNFTFPFGTHIAVVEVDSDTGQVDIKRYLSVDDVGNVINPLIVEGQVHGGIAQGIGQALYEEAVYDDNGQLVSATLLDYAVPKAHKLVSFETERTVTPCPHNPIGVKGVGEAGTIASPATIVNAVMDALKPHGVKHIDMPLRPEKIWKAIHANGGN